MAIVDKQKVDLLYKKLFGVAKTDFGTLKGASNESVPSPAFLRGDTIWTQSNLIPTPLAATFPNVVETRTVECVADTTTTPISGVYATWKTDYTNWIPPEFGATYFVKVYIDNPGAANPTATGTQIFDAGVADQGAWYFDYVSGVLNFVNYTDAGATSGVLPSGLTSSKRIYVVGYRYIGFIGVSNLQEGQFGNLKIVENNINAINENVTDGDVRLQPQINGSVRLQTSRLSQNIPNTGDSPTAPKFERTTFLARTSTLNGEQKEVTLDGLAAGATNRLFLENNFTYKFNVDITAKLGSGTDSAIWNMHFLARRGADATETSIIGNILTEKIAGSPATYITVTTVSAGNFINGRLYKIKTLGNTNWVNIAKNKAMDYSVGSVFEAEFVGADPSVGTTGVADEYFNPTQIALYSWGISAEADTTNGLIKVLVKGPSKISGADPDKTIYWLAAINTLEIYQT